MSPYTLALISLILGNLMASLSDVAVKLLEGDVPVFQYVFIRQLIAFITVSPIYFFTRVNTNTDTGKFWKINAIRGNILILGAGCMVIAITHLPLATANAVFYAGPLLMLPLSVWILKELPLRGKVFATVIGFAGVLIVLRPSQFHWAAVFALGTAFSIALFNILVKKIPSRQPVSHTLFWTSMYSLPVSGVLAWWQWQPIALQPLLWVVFSSIAILTYNGLAVYAYKKAEANQIALVEYTGLIFVTLFGIVWFDEVPDLLTLCGIALIVLPLIPKQSLQRLKLSATTTNNR